MFSANLWITACQKSLNWLPYDIWYFWRIQFNYGITSKLWCLAEWVFSLLGPKLKSYNLVDLHIITFQVFSGSVGGCCFVMIAISYYLSTKPDLNIVSKLYRSSSPHTTSKVTHCWYLINQKQFVNFYIGEPITCFGILIC